MADSQFPPRTPQVPPDGLPAFPYAESPEARRQSQKTNGFAIAGFVAGLVGAFVLGPVLSIIGLRRIKRHGGRGRGLAIAGLVLSGFWAGAIALAVAVGLYGSRADVGDTTPVS